MARNIFEDTFEFMSIGGHLHDSPIQRFSDQGNRELRRNLLAEEYTEYLLGEAKEDPIEIADGLADVIVIAFGTMLSYFGFIKTMQILSEVGASNLSKFVENEDGELEAILREDGKILKGPNHFVPDIAKILDQVNPES